MMMVLKRLRIVFWEYSLHCQIRKPSDHFPKHITKEKMWKRVAMALRKVMKILVILSYQLSYLIWCGWYYCMLWTLKIHEIILKIVRKFKYLNLSKVIQYFIGSHDLISHDKVTWPIMWSDQIMWHNICLPLIVINNEQILKFIGSDSIDCSVFCFLLSERLVVSSFFDLIIL